MEPSKFDDHPAPEIVEVDITKGPALDPFDLVVDSLNEAITITPLKIVDHIAFPPLERLQKRS